jgi:hypothetical protein
MKFDVVNFTKEADSLLEVDNCHCSAGSHNVPLDHEKWQNETCMTKFRRIALSSSSLRKTACTCRKPSCRGNAKE